MKRRLPDKQKRLYAKITGRREVAHQRAGLEALTRRLKLEGAVMVEVGSYTGESAEIFAKSGSFRKIYCVDPWSRTPTEAESLFDKRTKPYPEILKLKGRSVAASRQFSNASVDFVYIDADHRYSAVKADILAWLPKVKPGGWIGGHDYRWRFKGVIRAVDEELGLPLRVFQDSSWLVKVPKL